VSARARPPTETGEVAPHIIERHAKTQRFGSIPRREDIDGLALRFRHMSSRLFMLDREPVHDAVRRTQDFEAKVKTYPRHKGSEVFTRRDELLGGDVRSRPEQDRLLGSGKGMWQCISSALRGVLRSVAELIGRSKLETSARAARRLRGEQQQWAIGRRHRDHECRQRLITRLTGLETVT